MRYVLLPLLCLLLAPAAFAQWTSGSLRVGGSAFTYGGGPDAPYDPIAGFAGGAGYSFHFSPVWAAEAQLLYAQQGAAADSRIDGVPVRVRFAYGTLVMPLLGVARLPPRGRLQPKVFAGPYAAYTLDATLRYGTATGPAFTETDADAATWTAGVAAGAGLEVDLGGEAVALDLMVAAGLTEARGDGARPRGLVLTLGFHF